MAAVSPKWHRSVRTAMIAAVNNYRTCALAIVCIVSLWLSTDVLFFARRRHQCVDLNWTMSERVQRAQVHHARTCATRISSVFDDYFK
jgi:hypothetical protein